MNHWNTKSPSFHYEIYGRQSILHYKFQEWVREHNTIVSMLEVGCGVGIYANLYKWKDYYGNDLYDTGINYLKDLHDESHYFHGNFEQIKIPRKFDLVFSLQTIEHLEDPEKAIKKMIALSNRYVYIGLHTGLSTKPEHRKVDHDTYIQWFLSKKKIDKLAQGEDLKVSYEPFDYEAKEMGMIIKGEKQNI